MRVFKQTKGSKDRLLLVFAGWSVTPALFENLTTEEDVEVWICYDYRNLDFPEELSRFKEIKIVAWSLGVWVAGSTFPKIYQSRITAAVAVNGTLCPIHDTLGIPTAIFKGTLNRLTEEGIYRFNRRMCGYKEVFRYYQTIPARSLEEVKEELDSLYKSYTTGSTSSMPSDFWTQVLLSTGDLIFPIENLKNYWMNRCPVKLIETPHYPFYKWKRWEEIWKE